MNSAKEWIEKLNLLPHPEGGYFKEIYKSKETIDNSALPQRYSGDRNFYTSIYYLLEGKNFSAFHRLKSDEIWHFYNGSPLLIYLISPNGDFQEIVLGINIADGEVPQFLIPAGSWFAAKVRDEKSFSLIGCNVSPGFEYADFELGLRNELVEKFSDLKEIILKLTR
ncbi:MAG: cupin domain-containing protein [bacterium]